MLSPQKKENVLWGWTLSRDGSGTWQHCPPRPRVLDTQVGCAGQRPREPLHHVSAQMFGVPPNSPCGVTLHGTRR